MWLTIETSLKNLNHHIDATEYLPIWYIVLKLFPRVDNHRCLILALVPAQRFLSRAEQPYTHIFTLYISTCVWETLFIRFINLSTNNQSCALGKSLGKFKTILLPWQSVGDLGCLNLCGCKYKVLVFYVQEPVLALSGQRSLAVQSQHSSLL